MDCRLIQGELIAYHFATIDVEERERVDEHLLVCNACLRTYLRLKRQIDGGAAREADGPAPRPSDAIRQRLRADVESAFRPSSQERVRRWLRRPIPLYQGIAAAAVALLLAGAGPLIASAISSSAASSAERPAASNERIDTSRPSPLSLTFY